MSGVFKFSDASNVGAQIIGVAQGEQEDEIAREFFALEKTVRSFVNEQITDNVKSQMITAVLSLMILEVPTSK